MQTLSTLNISAGSLDENDSIRLFAYAGKITLYRSHDPLASASAYSDLVDEYNTHKTFLDSSLILLKHQFYLVSTREAKDSLERLIFNNTAETDQLNSTQKQKIQQRQQELKAKYWNTTTIDIAGGRSFSFNHFATEKIDSIKLKHRSKV